jgi:hypothetical protein
MSAALQLTADWEAYNSQVAWRESRAPFVDNQDPRVPAPAESLAFYRKHTEKMLRRYLYASTQVGRCPSVLCDPVGRGWASSRPTRTFEDAVIFVLDIEKCLGKLQTLDQQILARVVLQAYTQSEAAGIFGMCTRSLHDKYNLALDRFTELLLKAKLLVLPQ